MSEKRIYETVFVLHPELSEEEVETGVQSTIELLETRGSDSFSWYLGGVDGAGADVPVKRQSVALFDRPLRQRRAFDGFNSDGR